MTAYEYLKTIYLPDSKEGSKLGRPSNSEVKRWLMKGSVVINGENPKPNDEVTFPITSLVFFPKGRLRTTYV